MQFVSWIHDADFLGSIDYLIARDEIDGVVNIASPNPLRNREFMKALREAWGSRIGLPAASWMLEIGTLFRKRQVCNRLVGRLSDVVAPRQFFEHDLA